MMSGIWGKMIAVLSIMNNDDDVAIPAIDHYMLSSWLHHGGFSMWLHVSEFYTDVWQNDSHSKHDLKVVSPPLILFCIESIRLLEMVSCLHHAPIRLYIIWCLYHLAIKNDLMENSQFSSVRWCYVWFSYLICLSICIVTLIILNVIIYTFDHRCSAYSELQSICYYIYIYTHKGIQSYAHLWYCNIIYVDPSYSLKLPI